MTRSLGRLVEWQKFHDLYAARREKAIKRGVIKIQTKEDGLGIEPALAVWE